MKCFLNSQEDEVGVNPLIKVWNLEKTEPRTGNPSCRRITRAMPNNRPLTATALAVDPDLNAMAVGFQDGSVLLSRGTWSCTRPFLSQRF